MGGGGDPDLRMWRVRFGLACCYAQKCQLRPGRPNPTNPRTFVMLNNLKSSHSNDEMATKAGDKAGQVALFYYRHDSRCWEATLMLADRYPRRSGSVVEVII